MDLTSDSHVYSKDEIIDILKSEKCIDIFKKLNINSILLFGSIVTDNFEDYSDVDIAVLSEEKIGLDCIMDLEESIGSLINREIDIVVLNDEELDLRFKVTVYDSAMLIYNDALDLYSKDYNKKDVI